MKNKLKKILKWLVCVFLTFTVFFTISQFYEIGSGVYFRTAFLGDIERFQDTFGEENISDVIKNYDEMTRQQFLVEGIETTNDIFTKLYSQYPAGVTRTMSMIAQYIGYGDAAIMSLIFGVIIGTAIIMLMDKDKKGLKIAILIYIISIVILGFVQGILSFSGQGIYWIFPDEYIVLVSIAFALVVIVRYVKQKDIANKLNEKLKQIKEEKNK